MAETEFQTVDICVLGLQRVQQGALVALAVVELGIAGVVLQLQGVQVFRDRSGRLAVRAPQFRDASGTWRSAAILPDTLQTALAAEIFKAYGPV